MINRLIFLLIGVFAVVILFLGILTPQEENGQIVNLFSYWFGV
jgi:preprotein translocase subunit SecG